MYRNRVHMYRNRVHMYRNRVHIRHRPVKQPRKAANTDPYQSILNLNDDCLNEVLSYLPLQDLCSIGITCRRINIVAERLYSRFANLDAKYFLTKNKHNLTSNRKMGIIIKEIAHHVKSFQICDTICDDNGVARCQNLIRLVLLHCHNITSIKIGFKLDSNFLHEIYGFENFQKLEMIDIDTLYQGVPLEKLVCLKHLHLSRIGSAELLMLKNLESFLCTYLAPTDYDTFSKFCDNNPNLKRIEIGKIIANFVDLIVDKLKHLEEITVAPCIIDLNDTQLTNLERFSEIKSLKRFTGRNVRGLLEKLIDLDQLEWLKYNYPEPEEVNRITKLTKLKYLQVSKFNDIQLNSLKSQNILEHLDLDGSYVTNEGIANFVSGANSLKYLSLCSCFQCDEDVLDMLSNFVQVSDRKQKLTVRCDLIYRRERVNYPWLDIVCENIRDCHEYYDSS